MTKTKTKTESTAPTMGEDFQVFCLKHAPVGAAALAVFEVAETDENGSKRWQLVYRGNPALLESMSAFALSRMSSERERWTTTLTVHARGETFFVFF